MMVHRVVLALLLFLEIAVLPHLAKQEATAKNLYAVTRQSISSDGIEEYLRLMQINMHEHPDSAYQYFNLLYAGLKTSTSRTWDPDFYDTAFDLSGKLELGYDRRSQVFEILVSYAAGRGDNYELMLAYRGLSHLNYHVSRLDRALTFQLKAQEVSKRSDIPEYAKVFPYVSLSHIYKDRLEGVQYADTALTMIRQGDDLPPRMLHWVHTHLGSFFQRIGYNGEALKNFEIALDILRENSTLQVDAMLFLGMGRVYLAKGEYDKARNYLERAELENKKYVDGHPEIQIEAAETMIRLAQQSAQYALAEKYALKIVTAGHFAEYLKHKSLAHRTLYEIYTAWNMPEQAAEHLAQYFVVRDAFDQRKKANDTYLDVRALDVARKQQEMGAIEADLKVQTERVFTARVILICVLLICAVICVSWYRQKRLIKKLASKNKQIEAYTSAVVAINEQLVEARDRAKESDRIKTAILQNMSHEIRTPLTSILGFADMIEEEGHSYEIATQIKRGGRRLMNTLTSVLDLAQLESGNAMLNRRCVDVCNVVRGVVNRLAPVADEKNLDLVFEIKDADVLKVVTDRDAFERITNNLIHNAIHFTTTGNVRVNLYREEDNVVLRVIDTGIGMDTAFLPVAFEPFRQESEGEGRTHEGVGLGLAVARQLVELLGGRISVVSKKGEGSVFKVTLPQDA